MREALTWTGVWVTLSLLLGLGIYTGWIGSYAADERHTAALEFLTAYLIEVSLSIDNVFVFALLFNYFACRRSTGIGFCFGESSARSSCAPP